MNNSYIKLITLRGDKPLAEVATAVGISKIALAAYEVGKREPRDDVKKRLADYYGIAVGKLFLPNSMLHTSSHTPEFLLVIEAWEKAEAFSQVQKEKLLRILGILLSPGSADHVMFGAKEDML